MARALDFIEKGHEPGQVPPRPWQSLFHYDFKPSNILLDAPATNGPEWCSHYPLPILADFGGAEAYPQPGAADQIPSHIRGYGTKGFSPFELFQPNSQRLSNDERANGPARDTPVDAERNPLPPLPPTARARASPYKPPLPVDQQVRIHSSIFQLGVTIWCTMTNRIAPRGQVCAWRGGYAPNDNRSKSNAYPAWWDYLPRHAPRRPWPWKVAKPLRKKEWKAMLGRGLAEAPVVEYGPMHARRARYGPLPSSLDKLGARPKSYIRRMAGGMWVPLAPSESLKPRYSDQLVDLAYKCMSPLIADRPTTDGLLIQTQQEMNALQGRYPDGSGTGPEALLLPPDKFPIGQHTLNDVWRAEF
ncbi:hypothetical protein DBV05_g5761 [Lasiodiplodia theobromae]|uniref:Protein kinase domain-containing protein n=1 Tax=Lasiodiplodia theobromae TaxID=45133 RepID=A0A5N5DCT9_9PEZI|nr:hypothetical protein DBV05_g5761 [Lasiodiplodia theobromae]